MRRDGKVPTGRLRRLAQLAQMGTEAGAQFLLSSDKTRAAERAAEAFGSLRGLATKLGQMASYVDGLVPEHHGTVFEGALRELRDHAPHSPPALVRAQVESEFGAPIEHLFATWSDEPFASASIGQVHLATLHDGTRVAVKVQHPGVDQAIENDLANGSVIARLAGVVAPDALESERLYAEIAEHFREELDYRSEAAWQKRFAALHAGDPTVCVPRVFFERSSQRVLTTEYTPGGDLEAAMRRPEAERRLYAETMWRFVYRSILEGGLFNADPHPGNYLFRDGSVVFLDFGCVQALSPAVKEHSCLAHLAALAHDERAFARHAANLVQARGGPYEDAFVAYLRLAVEPIFSSPFHITREFARRLVTGLSDLKRSAFTKGSQFAPLPESTVLLNRLQLGFFSVLARLDVRADYAAVEHGFL